MTFRSFDGRDEDTELTGILKKRFRIKEVDDLVSKIYGNGLTVEQIAAVAPEVIRSARKDMISRRILMRQACSSENSCVLWPFD